MIFNCEANTHGQTVKSQPHTANVTNTLTLPAGGNQEIVGTTATQTLTNKSIDGAQLTGSVATARLDTGTSANQIVALDGSAKLPAVDGSQLTNITVTETDPSALAFAIALG